MSENSPKGDSETRAKFIDTSPARIGGDTGRVIRSALKKRNDVDDSENSTIVSSPLLSSTPSTISKSLVKIYPYLILADYFLGLLTWTNENIWSSILMVLIYITSVLYYDNLAKFFGHVVVVGLLWGYSLLDQHIEETMGLKPTLDDIVHIIDKVTKKFDMFFSPITILSEQDIKRLLCTTIFLSPIYVVITVYIFPPRTLLLIGGIYVLTYQSPWSKVTRRILWKFKIVRLMVFYITGLDLGGINNHQGILAAVHKQVKKLSSTTYDNDNIPLNGNTRVGTASQKSIRFTYVLYENERRWIGIGWTSSMLSYERTSWTDEFLNQAPSPEDFKLPEESSNMVWKWVDKTWRLDMTNDGAIQLSTSKARTTASPSADDGFIYYDNTWKKPSTADSFSKYTRRRRWVRTAGLIRTETENEDKSVEMHIVEITKEDDKVSKRPRSVTIKEEPTVFGDEQEKAKENIADSTSEMLINRTVNSKINKDSAQEQVPTPVTSFDTLKPNGAKSTKVDVSMKTTDTTEEVKKTI